MKKLNTITITLLSLLNTALLMAAASSDVGPQTIQIERVAYKTISYVDQETGDDVTADGSRQYPWASIVHALEHSGHATADKRVAILVSQGRYEQPTFTLRSHVDLYGGFASVGGKRDIYKYASVLDGSGDHRILLGSDDARLDGFHLSHGRVRGKGAAILLDGVSPIISNCVFVNNRTLIPIPWDPPLLHETAHDGGALMVLNGATPEISNNYFYDNATECGRGGALAVDLRAFPIVTKNVFANNTAGIVDPTRSSDGGAVSWFDWSDGEFSDNLIVANTALGNNDAGGIFIAMWAAPVVSGNIFVSNLCTDDAGGLFIGGQEHRYDAPLDEYPSKEDFNVVVNGNVFVGNRNSSDNSGAMRITMESRVHFTNNIIAENIGGMYLQRSEIVAENNTVWQDWKFIEDKDTLSPSHFTGNVLKGPVGDVEARVSFRGNMMESKVKDSARIEVSDIFIDDGVSGEFEVISFDSETNTTVMKTSKRLPSKMDLVNRSVRIDDDHEGGQWRVIKFAKGNELVIWGSLVATTGEMSTFDVLRSFTLKANAPKGIGAGSL